MKAVTIELDKPRKAMLTLNALIEFEEETGKDLTKMKETDFSMKDMRALLWATLLYSDEDLTIRRVGNMITTDNMEYINNKLGELYRKHTPEKGKKEKNMKRAAGK